MNALAKKSRRLGNLTVKVIGKKDETGESFEVHISFRGKSLCSVGGNKFEVLRELRRQEFHGSAFQVLEEVCMDLKQEKYFSLSENEMAVLHAIAHRERTREQIIRKTGLELNEFGNAATILGEIEALSWCERKGEIYYYLTPSGLNLHMELFKRNSEVVKKS